MTIQWFPGHMAKARREVEEKLKLIDFVMELLDARAPLSSQNPVLKNILQHKPKLTILMKNDLADQLETAKWMDYFRDQGHTVVAVDVSVNKDIQKVIQKAKELGSQKMEKLKKKGINPRPARAMIVGIPNVGKSTLINRLVGRKIARIGDRPGITKQQLWIKVKKDFELLDTPGILWPKFDDQMVGYRLAALGTIKDQLLSMQDITAFVIQYLRNHYPSAFFGRYPIEQDIDDMWDIFVAIGKQRGCLESGGKVNFDKVSETIIRDLRTGRIGQISLEKVDK